MEILHWKIHLEKSHKYYTQVFKVFYISQMAVTGTRLAYFIVWTSKDMYLKLLN